MGWMARAKILKPYRQAGKRLGLRAGGDSGNEVRKEMDEQKILEEKTEAAKKDLDNRRDCNIITTSRYFNLNSGRRLNNTMEDIKPNFGHLVKARELGNM
jgi:hypothetical protein